MSHRPLLLLDVDGPLNPHRAMTVPVGYSHEVIKEGDRTWKLLLNQQHGVELNRLAQTFELVWASSWEHGANRLIAPLLGLPTDLPVISWPPEARLAVPGRQLSWKTQHVAEWVGGRPFVWIDDEVDRHDRAYLNSRDGLGPHLLHRVEANRGLVQADFDTVRGWAEARLR